MNAMAVRQPKSPNTTNELNHHGLHQFVSGGGSWNTESPSVVVLVTSVNHKGVPTGSQAVEIFEDVQPGAAGIIEVVLSHYQVNVAVPVHIGHIQAHRPDNVANDVLGPSVRG